MNKLIKNENNVIVLIQMCLPTGWPRGFGIMYCASGQKSAWGVSLNHTLPQCVEANSQKQVIQSQGAGKHSGNDISISFSIVSKRTKGSFYEMNCY